jgi:Domain of unknown function (DUF4398)
MRGWRGIGRVFVVAALLALVGCADPPDKEIQQAQGAIDAARAAGAAVYAKDEFAAAETALKNAHDAVEQRDYRLALNFALDSRERAQSAAKEAADNKAVARSDADRALVESTAALAQAQARLKAAETRASPRALAVPKRKLADTAAVVQKARTDFQNGDYAAVGPALRPLKARLGEIVREIETAPPTPSRRRR